MRFERSLGQWVVTNIIVLRILRGQWIEEICLQNSCLQKAYGFGPHHVPNSFLHLFALNSCLQKAYGFGPHHVPRIPAPPSSSDIGIAMFRLSSFVDPVPKPSVSFFFGKP